MVRSSGSPLTERSSWAGLEKDFQWMFVWRYWKYSDNVSIAFLLMPNILAHTLYSGFPLQRRPVFLGYVMLAVSFPLCGEF